MAELSELLIARNPDPESTLPFLLRVPLGDGLLFRTSDTWPRTKALFCFAVHLREWPDDPEIVERVAIRTCSRRGAAIDLVLDRGREHRSQIVYTKGRGRDMVFWQSPRTRKQARPQVTLPTARAAGLRDLEIVVDSHERYPYRFATQQVVTTRAALPSGDYGIRIDGDLAAVVERKSLPDLTSSVTDGRLRFALAELAALPRAAVVVEERYSQVFTSTIVRPSVLADGLAELQVRYPNVPIVFCETRPLAEEWTYRFLAAAHQWVGAEAAAPERVAAVADLTPSPSSPRPGAVDVSTAQVRAWARGVGITVPERGRLRPEVWEAWHARDR